MRALKVEGYTVQMQQDQVLPVYTTFCLAAVFDKV